MEVYYVFRLLLISHIMLLIIYGIPPLVITIEKHRKKKEQEQETPCTEIQCSKPRIKNKTIIVLSLLITIPLFFMAANAHLFIREPTEPNAFLTDNDTEPDSVLTVRDTVRYTDLQVGKTYKIVGTLMDKDTNKPITDSNGNPVTAEIEFIAKEPSGTVELSFNFPAMSTNDNFVIFEELHFITERGTTWSLPVIMTKN